MTDHLALVLAHLGFDERPQQRALYEHLVATTPSATVVQAGTGTGKVWGCSLRPRITARATSTLL